MYNIEKGVTYKMKKFFHIFTICAFSLFTFSSFIIPVHANGEITRRGLILSAEYDSVYVNDSCTTCMRNAFLSNNISVSTYVHSSGLSSTTFLNKISQYLGNADEDDVSYVYIIGHGDQSNHIQIGNDGTCITLQQLRNALDIIPGKIVLMIDSCYSGQAINPRDLHSEHSISPAEIIKNNFLYGLNNEYVIRDGEFYGMNKYSVICASKSNEIAIGSGTECSYASRIWAHSMGFYVSSGSHGSGTTFSSRTSDTNHDHAVTAQEFQNDSDHILQVSCPSPQTQHFCYYFPNNYFTIVTDDYNVGDVTIDDSVSLSDVLALNKHLANIELLTGRGLELSDINSDSDISMADILALRQLVAIYP